MGQRLSHTIFIFGPYMSHITSYGKGSSYVFFIVRLSVFKIPCGSLHLWVTFLAETSKDLEIILITTFVTSFIIVIIIIIIIITVYSQIEIEKVKRR